ncbi:hypothetical protein BH18VER1_BH18VER1_06580 [soil metagenome]
MKRTTSPAKHLQSELQALRGELRATVRAYTARLEVQLAESVAAMPATQPPADLSREQLHEIRDLLSLLRKRKLKPEKGRQKDLRKIDSLIGDIHAAMHPQSRS